MHWFGGQLCRNEILFTWVLQEMLNIAAEYKKAVEEKDELPPVKLATAKVGKQATNKHLEQLVSNFKSSNIGWTFGTC